MRIQYLGFRYHGYFIQSNAKTVQEKLERTLGYVLGKIPFKTLASGRTDTLVSANEMIVELFLEDQLLDENKFCQAMNDNLPVDIRLLEVSRTIANFNVIQHPKAKVYKYYFCFGEKYHPFAAPFLAHFSDDLDLSMMQWGAKQFLGTHNLIAFCKKPKDQTMTIRTVDEIDLSENRELTASFFPEKSYCMKVKASGFMRNQIRLMMGALVHLGSNKLSKSDFLLLIDGQLPSEPIYLAPANGLILDEIYYQ
ncbi:MAG: tRNA pseudouridine(38-40) synthase TruA [Cyclobacteriaceae bacterium]|nr:tRNA pseudouridine(38-40) synthase TruA [Cyclobacteriaceae bacterium]